METLRETAVTDYFSSAQVRALDAHAIKTLGIPGYTLMTRAAAAALQALRARWSAARELLIVCGGGNNGGDGYVLARLALAQGYRCRVLSLVDPARLAGDAAQAMRELASIGVPIERTAALDMAALAKACAEADVIVDAMLGIGLDRDVEAPIAGMIELIAACGRPVIALDIPSGLCADSGRVRGRAIRAALTVSFVAAKSGLALGAGPDHTGEVLIDPLGIATSAWPDITPRLQGITAAALRVAVHRRARDTHKGVAGHLVVIGGGVGMPGAARLAALGALRAGAGRVTVLCADASMSAVAAGNAEIMVNRLDALERLASVSALVAGPGLGRDAWAHDALDTALAFAAQRAIPLLLDADALTVLAQSDRSLPAGTILTPHPGEAVRLLGSAPADVQADRLHALEAMLQRRGGIVVLKGAGTLVGEAGSVPAICLRGGPILAAPGTGDVLAGIIGALCGQGVPARRAAEAGVWWHAVTAEQATRRSTDTRGASLDRGLLASELANGLPSVLAELLAGGTL